ncbi:protein phosphatase 2C domain-containing protein [Streptomyces lydicus]|uniref:protein phosphatase 2C domain-containing protein n=1 Tax=Streptomyces lydicus TaxID=47763 RepID=UPI002E30E49A|nr:protein phosphatase 2C domain-containing protein [Streptomyces lydicus]
MSEQGARRGQEDDWWRQLYGEEGGVGAGGGGAAGHPAGSGAAPAAGAPTGAGPADVGPAEASDTLDERVASVLRTVGPPGWGDRPPPQPTPADAPDRAAPAGDAPPDETPPRAAPTPPDEMPPRLESDRPAPPDETPPRPEPDRAAPAAPAPPDETPTPGPVPPGEPPARRVPSPPPPPSEPIPLKATGPGARPRDVARSAPPPPPPAPAVTYIGDRPPTYEAEPAALPAADPAALDELVPDTALEGAQYGSLTLRAASQRGDSARYRGDVRRDALLTARFGAGRHALILVAVATGRPAVEGAHRAARDACGWIGGAVGRSYTQLAEDIRADRRGDLKAGLQRLTDRSYGKLRARALERGGPPEQYTAALRCLLLSADPDCRTRVFFGVGAGGLFRLRDGAWTDLEPVATDHGTPAPTRATDAPARPGPGLPHGPGTAEYPARPEPFLFHAAFARPGDALLLCSAGLAEPLRQEPAFAAHLADRWSTPEPPGLVPFLATAQLRAKGHAKDRTAVAVWEA